MNSGPFRISLLAVAALLAAPLLLPAEAAAAKKDCIKTYNKQGEVTGEYCAEGLTDPAPGGGGETADGTPAIVDPGPAPDTAGTAAKAARKRALPKGNEIRCSAAQKAAGQRCLGVFDLSL